MCGTANVDLVRSLGADDVIDYTARDFTDGGPRHDVIVDLLGKAGFPRSLRALERGGRYLLVGFPEGLGGIARVLLTGALVHLRGRARFITGAAAPKQADLVFLQELIDAGRLRTVIGRRYTLDEIVEAHRYAESGHKIGNVAVLIGRWDRAGRVGPGLQPRRSDARRSPFIGPATGTASRTPDRSTGGRTAGGTRLGRSP